LKRGRAQVTKGMIQSFNDLIITILMITCFVFKGGQVWNFDETGTKPEYHQNFLWGIKGVRWSQRHPAAAWGSPPASAIHSSSYNHGTATPRNPRYAILGC